MIQHRIFVYGTLKDGFPNFAINGGRRLPGRFVTAEAYPFFLVLDRHSPWLLDRPGEGHRVAGELYEVDAAGLAAMDRLERVGEPGGYLRRTIAVVGPDGALDAQAYLKDPALLDPAEVKAGPLAEYLPEHAALYRRR